MSPGKANTGTVALDFAMRRAGTSVNDIEIVALPFPDMVGALAGGSVDAALVLEPFQTRVLEQGTAVRLMGMDEMYPNFSLAQVGFSADFYANRPAAKAFLRGYIRALRHYDAALQRPPGDPARREIDALVASYSKIPLEVVQKMIPIGLSPNGRFSVQSVLDSYQWFLREGLIPQPLRDAEIQGLLGTELLDEVLAEMGAVPET